MYVSSLQRVGSSWAFVGFWCSFLAARALRETLVMGASADAVPTLTPYPKRKGGGQFGTSGSQCIAAGNGLSGGAAGVVAVVSVRCRDARNEPRTVGGDVVLVQLTSEGGPSIDAHVVDNEDGTYTCTYLPTFASANCKVSVSVNGTRIVGSPFPAQVVPGQTDAQQSEVFGHGLNDGVAGQPNRFTIQTKDPFGNRCVYSEGNPEHFNIVVRPVHSLIPEFATFLRKYEVPVQIQDNEDGTYSVEYMVEYPGFYAIEVTYNNVPVGESPYTACICNPTIAMPPQVTFNPLAGDASALPEGLRSCDMVRVHDSIFLLKSLPTYMTSGRREREFLHYYTLTSAMARGKEEWRMITLRGSMYPPPYRRHTLAIDQKMLLLCHSDVDGDEACEGRTPPDTMRLLDLSDLGAKITWSEMRLEGKRPSMIEGYGIAVWESKQSILVCGGRNAEGTPTNDIYMLTLGGGMNSASVGSWRVLAEWPACIFSGTGFSERCNHSLTWRDGTSSFWVFGGRGIDGQLLNDVVYFDMEEEQFSTPQCLNEPPAPRECHSACFVADRYLVCYGGYDVDGNMHTTAAVYDVVNATWQVVENVVPRAHHRIVSRGGVMYIFGGVGEDGQPAPPVPLESQVFPFSQASSFDFLGNNAQAVIIKPSPSLGAKKVGPEADPNGPGMTNKFSVEAVFYARSFSGNSHNPIIVKGDNGLKSGFGLLGQEHPAYNGDAEEGPWVHFYVGAWTQGGHQMVGARIELETWVHVAATYDGHTIQIFVNGSSAGEKTVIEWDTSEEEAELMHTKGNVMIGGMPGKYAFDGMIDECRLWDVCRNEEEIKEYMNKPATNPRTPGLLGQWTFNEGSGDLIIDSSGQKNHATFDRYAGGIELRRVQSRRPFLEVTKSEREKHIEENFNKLQAWKNEFEEKNGRPANKADMLLAGEEISGLARRLGVFEVEEEKPAE